MGPGYSLPAEPGNGKGLKPASPLPIARVVLFNSGVGYFQRTGMVEGDARVDLQFQTGDINDLIKSLVIEDKKGTILPVRYDSQEPIEKTLRSFAINLSSNPTYGEILNQARGEKVELTLSATSNGLPGTLQGTIIGMEEGKRLALRHATGEIIVFLDADNEVTHPDYFSLAVAALQKNPQALGLEAYYLASPKMSVSNCCARAAPLAALARTKHKVNFSAGFILA